MTLTPALSMQLVGEIEALDERAKQENSGQILSIWMSLNQI